MELLLLLLLLLLAVPTSIEANVCGSAEAEPLLSAFSPFVRLTCGTAQAGCHPTRPLPFPLPTFGRTAPPSQAEMIRIGVDTDVVQRMLAGPTMTESTIKLLQTPSFINGTTTDGKSSLPIYQGDLPMVSSP
jgi:hypothetical protein